MCSNYRVRVDLATVAGAVGAAVPAPFEWPELIRPTDPAPVVFEVVGAPVVLAARFGLRPALAVSRPRFATHNARIETLADKATWREPLRAHRCLVPMTSFLEPIYDGEFAGHMVRFAPPSRRLLFAAGVAAGLDLDAADRGGADRGDPGSWAGAASFAVITRPASPLVAAVGHDRQPFFVDPTAIRAWLSGGRRAAEESLQILRAHPDTDALGAAPERPMARGWERRRRDR